MWFFSIAFILVKGNLVAPWEASFLNLDLVIICIGYLLIRYDRTAVALFALVQGLMIDIYSAGIFGLFSFIYTGLFAGMVIGSRFLDLASLKGAVILISLAVFVKDLFLIVLLNVFSRVILKLLRVNIGLIFIVLNLVESLVIIIVLVLRLKALLKLVNIVICVLVNKYFVKVSLLLQRKISIDGLKIHLILLQLLRVRYKEQELLEVDLLVNI